MIELTWHIEDAEGDSECGAFEVKRGSSAEQIRDAALADYDERSASFDDWAGVPVSLWVEYPSGRMWDLSHLLTSPLVGEHTIHVSHTMEG